MKDELGGFVDPNTLMIDKLACANQLHLWSVKYNNSKKFSGADRKVFEGLSQNKTWSCSNRATVYYKVRRKNVLWHRAKDELAKQKVPPAEELDASN